MQLLCAVVCTKVGAAGSVRGRRPGGVGVGRRFLGGGRFGFGGRHCGGARLWRHLRLLHLIHVLRLCGLWGRANKPASGGATLQRPGRDATWRRSPL